MLSCTSSSTKRAKCITGWMACIKASSWVASMFLHHFGLLSTFMGIQWLLNLLVSRFPSLQKIIKKRSSGSESSAEKAPDSVNPMRSCNFWSGQHRGLSGSNDKKYSSAHSGNDCLEFGKQFIEYNQFTVTLLKSVANDRKQRFVIFKFKIKKRNLKRPKCVSTMSRATMSHCKQMTRWQCVNMANTIWAMCSRNGQFALARSWSFWCIWRRMPSRAVWHLGWQAGKCYLKI